MIKPTFKYISKYEIKIIDEDTGQGLGEIISPAATIVGKESAIQVCGFDYACDLWSCGIYGYLDKDGKYTPKKDIQLLWTTPGLPLPGQKFEFDQKRRDGINNCPKCYTNPCKCDQLRIYKSGEPLLDKL